MSLNIQVISENVFKKCGTVVKKKLVSRAGVNGDVCHRRVVKEVVLPENHKLRQLGVDKFASCKEGNELSVVALDANNQILMGGKGLKSFIKQLKESGIRKVFLGQNTRVPKSASEDCNMIRKTQKGLREYQYRNGLLTKITEKEWSNGKLNPVDEFTFRYDELNRLRNVSKSHNGSYSRGIDYFYSDKDGKLLAWGASGVSQNGMRGNLIGYSRNTPGSKRTSFTPYGQDGPFEDVCIETFVENGKVIRKTTAR